MDGLVSPISVAITTVDHCKPGAMSVEYQAAARCTCIPAHEDLLAQEPAEKVARASIKYRVRVQSDHIPSIKPECSMELGTSKATSHSPCRYRERRQC